MLTHAINYFITHQRVN